MIFEFGCCDKLNCVKYLFKEYKYDCLPNGDIYL